MDRSVYHVKEVLFLTEGASHDLQVDLRMSLCESYDLC